MSNRSDKSIASKHPRSETEGGDFEVPIPAAAPDYRDMPPLTDPTTGAVQIIASPPKADAPKADILPKVTLASKSGDPKKIIDPPRKVAKHHPERNRRRTRSRAKAPSGRGSSKSRSKGRHIRANRSPTNFEGSFIPRRRSLLDRSPDDRIGWDSNDLRPVTPISTPLRGRIEPRNLHFDFHLLNVNSGLVILRV